MPEAFETEDGLITAIQWHPEQMFEHHPRQLALFAAFIQDARDRSTSHHNSWSTAHA
jgi:gamma-glutamyl-gamma-aminobutyrate hydrolase PuuD